ncbi:MAG: TonB-dependent receptor [Gammaproteobacteria bacterium]|nr:TonB-dependent receptor [Gammaproteobacteria bacterium]
MERITGFIVALTLVSVSVFANDENEESFIEEVRIVGNKEDAQQIAGSAHFIGPEELEKFNYSDIQRISREVPGVSIQLEDGYGLRPNISIRGVATERSSRITLLEDNVLIAPAPYSAPSAYYFPTAGRMHAFEVLKGPASITQGPYTIGGTLNMLSTPIPEKKGGMVMAEGGEDSTYRVHALYGDTLDNGVGFLVETHQWGSNGFQNIDRGGSDSGLEIQDYTVKLRYAPEGSRHKVNFKFQYADQDSEQSYLGLSDADFASNANRRYGLSVLDNIQTEHFQYIGRYQFEISDSMTFTATGYNNEHSRSWFKTEGLDADGSTDAQDFDRTSWFNVIQAVNSGSSLDGLSTAQLQGILDGTLDTAPGSIQLRANDREYYSRGGQFKLAWDGEIGETSHSLEVGLRYHWDEEDRLQRNSTYSQQGGTLVLDDLGELGNAGNRIQEAEALAIHVYDRIEWGNWTFTPGIRYEDIDQKRTRFRDGATRTFRDDRENKTKVWLPGMGVLYQLSDEWQILAGAHKGFSAPSNSPGVREEKAINYEFGFRYQGSNLRGEVIGFISDYDNILGECTASSGTGCTIGDAFNGDAATVQGVEMLFAADLTPASEWNVPVSLTYTYIDAEFDTDIADTDFFGDVTKGDPIPYIPDHQLRFTVGVEHSSWGAYLNANYVDEVCVRASCDAFEQTDDTFTLDLTGNYQFSENINFFGRIENLTDAEDILGRQPYGARPNKDRTATIGARYTF